MGTQHRGAGGTSGGSLSFVVGLIMACAGGYMLLNSIVVSSGWGFGAPLYRIGYGGGFNITGGALLIPFMFGIGWIFYNARSVWGWIMAGGALAAIIFGVIINLSITMQSMPLLNLIVILVLMVGGLGMFARSLRST
jgi:hypothetical protein